MQMIAYGIFINRIILSFGIEQARNTRNQNNDQNFQPHKSIPVFDLVIKKADIPHHKKHTGKQKQHRQAA